MGKNLILTRLALFLTLAQRCTRFMRRSLRWRIFSTDKNIDTGEPGYENMYNDLTLTLHYDFEKQYYDPHDIFSEILIPALNLYREKYLKTKDKSYWKQMIQLLPSSYNQTRNVMMNYEVMANIYKSRRHHKLDEWKDFCEWIETLPYSELIMSAAGLDNNSINARQGLVRNKKGGVI